MKSFNHKQSTKASYGNVRTNNDIITSTMHQKMGKVENNKNGRHNTNKFNRKSLLGSSTLAVFLQPTLSDVIISTNSQNGGVEVKSQHSEFSAASIFTMLKDVNKVMVKGAKLYESLNELRLCGWINPYTLLLIGPSEDLKVVKHAWVKRHLKSPKGYFVKDIGIIQDCVVEMIPQSPFMSLTTALFDAVADLNHQNIFPTKDTLYEYLRKHYPEIKTPETKIIHDCLGRLIKNRRLYHNGRGYFILLNENVLNEVIALKSSIQHQPSDCSSYEPSILGFTLNNESRTSSSGQTDGHTDGHTDLDLKASNTIKNMYSSKRRDSSSAGDTLTEVSILDVPEISEISTPRTLGSRFFRRNNSKQDKHDKKTDQTKQSKLNNSKVFSCGIGGTPTDSVILSNGILDSPLKFSPTVKTSEKTKNDVIISRTITNRDVVDSSVFSDDTICDEVPQKTIQHTPPVANGYKRKIRRSKSFSGKSNKSKSQKEVSFALVGSPSHIENNNSSDSDQPEDQNYFKQRSFSFGVGHSKNIYQRPEIATLKMVPTVSDLCPDLSINGTSSYPDDVLEQSLEQDIYDSYRDLENSFVDDSVPTYDPDANRSHRPDMLPLDTKAPLDMIHNYKDLGSALSLPGNTDRTGQFTVLDLLSPTKEESLAEELKQAYGTSPPENDKQPEPNNKDDDLNSIDLNLLSPRSRRKFGTPYESQYISEVLEESAQICKALEDSKKDKNSNYIRDTEKSKKTNNTKSSKTSTSKDSIGNSDKKLTTNETGGVKLRLRSKSNEERKKNQKERNSQLFEEKRASLKVMGMV